MNNPIIRFLGILLLGYFLLAGLFSWKPVQRTVHNTYRSISESVLSTAFPELKIKTSGKDDANKPDISQMRIDFTWGKERVDKAIAEGRRQGLSDISVPHRNISYYLFRFFSVPLAFLLALILATPMSIKRKTIGGVSAIALLLAFLFYKLFYLTKFSISKSRIGLYELDFETMESMQRISGLMTMGLSIMICFFLWLVFLFRNSDLKFPSEQWANKLINK